MRCSDSSTAIPVIDYDLGVHYGFTEEEPNFMITCAINSMGTGPHACLISVPLQGTK
ncbi:hypothetical protein PITCH_A1020006 [uncultured Desulfobacterium sp.]|uniref:Uncharacterized protein n=1 Tax=uncultured Desulfobacterium sp. TaxID=201089 RepID=A0A445MQN8_9BACT|nr:hypothetical protein PITCH_A1020006 [uncultured Desulfobacterium sp.]